MSSQDIFTQNNDNIEIITLPGNQVESIETNVVLVPEQQQLLIYWGCEELLSDFIEKGIDVECFKEMTELDIQNLIPSAKYGLRIKFRSRLLNWRKENGFPLIALSDTLSMGSSVPTWISSSSFSENLESSPTSSHQSLFEIQPTDITLTDNKTKTLEQILQTTIVGKSILDISKKNETLSFKSRNDLCELIAHFWIINDFQHVLSSQYCRELVDSILKLFPIEDKEYYISTNKKRKGKLAEKYYSLLRKYREKGVIESRYQLKRQKKNHINNSENIENPEKNQETEDTEIFDNQIGNQLWLKSNKQPEALVVEKWRSTFDLRLKHIRDEKDIFFEWPILKQQIGISLIEVDFDKLYPNKSQLLFSKWDEFKTKINNIYKKNIKDSSSKYYFNLVVTGTNIDSEDYLLCILLNSILIPTGIHTKKDGIKNFWKPSILDGQEFMAIQVQTENDIGNIVKQHREKLKEKGLTNQPLLIVVGELTKLEKFYVNLQDYFYECDSFKKSLSVIIQIFYVLNLKFPCPCQQAYEFFMLYFYDITLETRISNKLIQLLAELKI